MDILSILGYLLGIGFILLSIVLGDGWSIVPEQLKGFFDSTLR